MSLSLPPGTRNGLGVKSSTPAPQVGVACSLWRRPVPWTRVQCCHGMAAGEGKGTQPDPAQPTVARPKGKGKGHPQDPSSGKGKGKGKEQNKGKPYASCARQDQEAEEA